MPLKLEVYKSITVLTGAGISVTSGLRSFRGPNGLWSDPDTERLSRSQNLFIAVGTSGTVSPAAHFVEWAKYAGAHTVLVNLEPMNPPNRAFDREVLGPAEETLATLFG